jgi:hypothetical protein
LRLILRVLVAYPGSVLVSTFVFGWYYTSAKNGWYLERVYQLRIGACQRSRNDQRTRPGSEQSVEPGILFGHVVKHSWIYPLVNPVRWPGPQLHVHHEAHHRMSRNDVHWQFRRSWRAKPPNTNVLISIGKIGKRKCHVT